MKQVKSYLIAENAVVYGDVQVSDYVNIWYGCSIRGDLSTISIGKYTNIQDNCVLHTDPDEPMTIGGYVTIGHGAIVHCKKIGDYTLIGMGAVLLAGAQIGSNCLIAAGAVVRENQIIPDNTVFAGVPAKQISTRQEGKFADHEDRAIRYYDLGLSHVKNKSYHKWQ